MNSLDQKIFLTFLGVVFLSLLSLTPQILHQAEGYSGSAIVNSEEYVSLARINWARQNYPSVCNHATFENKNDTCFYPDLGHRILGRVSYYFDLTPEQILIVGRPFLTMIIFLMLLSIALKCELRFGFAYFFSLFCFLSPSSYHFKPMLSWLTGDFAFSFNKITNPLVPLSFYFGTLICLCNIAFSHSHHIKSIFFGILFLATTFSLPYPYWISLTLVSISLVLIVEDKKRKLKVLSLFIMALLFGISAIIDFIELRSLPHMTWVLWRNGLALADHSYHLTNSVALWFVFGLSFLLFKKDHPIHKDKKIFLFIFFMSSFVCYLSPILIGKSFRNDIFKFILVPSSMLIYAQALFYFHHKYGHKLPKYNWKSSSRTSFAMLIVLIVFSLGQYAALRFYDSGRELSSNTNIETVRKALNEISMDLSPDDVFIANDQIMNMIPGVFGMRIFRDSATEMTESSEIFARTVTQFKLMGLLPEQLREHLNLSDNLRIWPWGLNMAMQEFVVQSRFSPAQGELKENLIKSFIKDYSESTEELWHKRLYQYRLNYLITLPDDQWDIAFIRSFFDMNLVYDKDGVKIFRLNPNRHQ